MDIKQIHRWMGIVTVVAFVLTGLYMLWRFPGMYEPTETIRYLFRANHIYVLMAGLLNLVLGTYLIRYPVPWKARLQRVGSVLVLIAPALLLAAFFIEPPLASPERPLTAGGIFAMSIGVLCHLIATFYRAQADT